MKIGIACVYYYMGDQEWLLRLQLQQIARCTTGALFKVYAAANRLPPNLRAVLSAESFVRIVELPQFLGEGNEEHAHYLDRLLETAYDDGCTHLCSLDADSFPILPGWPDYLQSAMRRCGAAFAAVHRTENLDRYLPHPSGYFMTREFYGRARPLLLPGGAKRIVNGMEAFLAATAQRPDTGIGYGWYLWEHNVPWLRLERSNRMNLHYLIAGVYGNTFFHMGAVSRAPLFSRDARTTILWHIRKWKQLPVLWRLYSAVLSVRVRRIRKIVDVVKARLIADPSGFFAELQGSPKPCSQAMCCVHGRALPGDRGAT